MEKYVHHNRETEKMGILHTSKKGSLGDRPTDRPTDHALFTPSFTIGGIYLRSKGKERKERVLYRSIYIGLKAHGSRQFYLQIHIMHSCLPFLRKCSLFTPACSCAPTKVFYYLSFVSASTHVKQAVLLTAFDEA